MAIVLGKQGQTALAKVQERSAAVTKPIQVQVVPIDSIRLWSHNPRNNEAAVPKLAEVLKVDGQVSPLIVWEKDKTIYKGNTTWKAAKSLGWKSIQVAFVSFPSAQAAAAYAIRDNKASEWSEWDDSVLAGILRSDEAFFGVENTGFTEKELTALRLSSDMPDKLDASAIIGDSETMGDFIIIRFETAEQTAEWRDYLGLKGNEKVITADRLSEYLK